MAEELGWDEETFEAEIKDAEGLIASMGLIILLCYILMHKEFNQT
mgnify:CR=1 FL=1